MESFLDKECKLFQSKTASYIQGIFGTVNRCNCSFTFWVATHLGYHIYFPTGLSKSHGNCPLFKLGKLASPKIAVATTPYFQVGFFPFQKCLEVIPLVPPNLCVFYLHHFDSIPAQPPTHPKCTVPAFQTANTFRRDGRSTWGDTAYGIPEDVIIGWHLLEGVGGLLTRRIPKLAHDFPITIQDGYQGTQSLSHRCMPLNHNLIWR